MFLLISEGQSSGPSSVDEGALGDSLRPSSLGAGVSSSSSSSGASCLSSSSSSCSPSGSSAEWQYLLIETSSQSSDGSSEGRLAGVLSSLLEKGMADDGVWPEGAAQQQNIWNIRESIAPAMAHQVSQARSSYRKEKRRKGKGEKTKQTGERKELIRQKLQDDNRSLCYTEMNRQKNRL
eukprot:GHVT01033923.1.p3 GENE.GHVT01033923.1~~GHVT01033923.1.p3  ORF type:complete len:179 (-),score=55.43 GHVT01033923.1:4705-5241(-)